MEIYIYIYIYIYTHTYTQQKLIKHCKLTILQFLKKAEKTPQNSQALPRHLDSQLRMTFHPCLQFGVVMRLSIGHWSEAEVMYAISNLFPYKGRFTCSPEPFPLILAGRWCELDPSYLEPWNKWKPYIDDGRAALLALDCTFLDCDLREKRIPWISHWIVVLCCSILTCALCDITSNKFLIYDQIYLSGTPKKLVLRIWKF